MRISFISAGQAKKSGIKEAAADYIKRIGLHESIRERCGEALSLSNLTLPHGLARLVLFEQVYRAFTIIKGEPYSH